MLTSKRKRSKRRITVAISISPNGRNHYETESAVNTLLVATLDGIVAVARRDAKSEWREAGRMLLGNHIASIAVEPRSGTIFAGVHNGGLWASADNGQNWERRDNGIEFENIYGLNYVEAGNEVRLYAGTDPAHIYVSSNLGES